jgi:glycosyltransferase involved in cell wall biosynthesis
MANPALRIAHVTATFPPYQGGTGTVCYYNTRELARRGHDVTVFTAAMDGVLEHETLEGVQVRRLRSVARVGNAALLPQLVPVLSRFDIIHLHLPFIAGGELTSLAAALHRVPLVVTYHSDLVRDGTWRDLVFQAATWSSRRAVLMRADAVLFVSEGHAETCDQRAVYRMRRGGCRVLPNGVDTTLFQPGLDREETRRRLGMSAEHPVVGFVGALDRAHHYKGLEILMTALSGDELGHVQLLVVGDGDWKEHYQRRAAALQLDGRTTFLGKVGHESLPPLYRACDVLAVPSLVPESFGLVIAESFACGTPALVSDGPGVRSLVEHGTSGLLVPPGDVRALRQGLVELLAMPDDTRKAMGEAGRRKVEECYTWQRVGCFLDRTYADVMAKTYSKNTTSCSPEAK